MQTRAGWWCASLMGVSNLGLILYHTRTHILTMKSVKRAPIKPVADLTEAVDIRAQLHALLTDDINQGTKIAQEEDNTFISVNPPVYSAVLRADEKTGVNQAPVRVLSLGANSVLLFEFQPVLALNKMCLKMAAVFVASLRWR